MNRFSKFWFRKCCDSLFKPWPTGYAYNPAYINACLSINNSYINISKCLKKRNFSSIMQRNRNAFALLWHFAYGLLIVFGKSRILSIVRYKYYYLTCFLFNLVHRGTYIRKPHRLHNVKIISMVKFYRWLWVYDQRPPTTRDASVPSSLNRPL